MDWLFETIRKSQEPPCTFKDCNHCRRIASTIREEIRKQAEKFIKADMLTGKKSGAIREWDERILRKFLNYLK